MKKLKIKVFSVIFSLLTIFTLIIFVTSTTSNYIERKKTITDILTNASRMGNKNNEPTFPPDKEMPKQDTRRIYLDFTIYTIILDDNGNYSEIINNTNNDDYN